MPLWCLRVRGGGACVRVWVRPPVLGRVSAVGARVRVRACLRVRARLRMVPVDACGLCWVQVLLPISARHVVLFSVFVFTFHFSACSAARQASATAAAYETYKLTYKDTAAQCKAQGLQFVPLVAESSGEEGPSAVRTLYRIAKTAGTREDQDADEGLGQYYPRLSVVIRRAHGEAVLRRVRGAAGLPKMSVSVDVHAEVERSARDDLAQ